MVRSCLESRPPRRYFPRLPEPPATDHRIYIYIYIYGCVLGHLTQSYRLARESTLYSYVGGNLPAVGEKRIVIKGIFKPSMLQK